MTRQDRSSFTKAWPELSRRLEGLLASRGVSKAARDDIAQETGLRLIRMWDRIDSESPLWPLAATIAMNLVRDDARKGRDRELVGDLPDSPAFLDVEEAALAKIELQRIGKALTHLTQSHRDALLGEVLRDEVPSSRTGSAAKMVRMRARRRLALVLEGLAAWGAGVSHWFKKESEWLPPVTASVLTAAAFVAGVGWPGSVAEPPAQAYPARPPAAIRVANASSHHPTQRHQSVPPDTIVPDVAVAPSGPGPALAAAPTPRGDGSDRTTIFEVDSVDDSPEKTSVQVLDTYIRVGEQGSDKPVCVDNSPVGAPGGTDCSESPAP